MDDADEKTAVKTAVDLSLVFDEMDRQLHKLQGVTEESITALASATMPVRVGAYYCLPRVETVRRNLLCLAATYDRLSNEIRMDQPRGN